MIKRRGVHSLIAVSMLIGFTVSMAGILLYVMADYADIVAGGGSCELSDISLYDTGVNRAYFVMSLHNSGSDPITSANVTFRDDTGAWYGFREDSLDIASGQVWSDMGSFPATIRNSDYPVRAAVEYDSGSTAECAAKT